jgi:hypothetical protein
MRILAMMVSAALLVLPGCDKNPAPAVPGGKTTAGDVGAMDHLIGKTKAQVIEELGKPKSHPHVTFCEAPLNWTQQEQDKYWNDTVADEWVYEGVVVDFNIHTKVISVRPASGSH